MFWGLNEELKSFKAPNVPLVFESNGRTQSYAALLLAGK